MNPNGAHDGDQSDYDVSLTKSGPQRRSGQREAVHLRNHDFQWAYDLDVELLTTDGQVAYRERFYLQPGHTETVTNAIENGEYELRVTLDNDCQKTTICHIDDTPKQTAVIEVGNGALSLTDGPHT